jgi:cullin 3
MFTDKRLSEELMETFRQRLELRTEELPHALHVFVLTSGLWPPAMALPMTLPSDTARCGDIFRSYYLGRHKGRRLEFIFSQGTVDIRLAHGTRKFELNVPTMCMPVLMLFDSGDAALAVSDIAEKVGLPSADAAKAVASLARAAPAHTGVLSTSNEGGASSSAITSSTQVRFNKNFKSKHTKIRIIAVVAAKEREAVATAKGRERLDDDRKYKIDAAVVRVMKSRRTLEHKALVTEVVTVIKTFVPTAEDVKRRIEHLIEREFLERSEQSRAIYNYLA